MLESVAKWTPFRIDALGIVTMLGAEEIDRAVGRLIENPIAEYLPLLGAFVIAGNRYVQPVPGVVLYNITDGIMATDVSGWMSRWLLKQEPRWNTTTYIWGVSQKNHRVWRRRAPALVIGFVVNFGLLALTVLVRDWFGFANAVAMIISVFVRSHLVWQNKQFLDRTVSSLKGTGSELVKAFCILCDGKAVSLFAPRGIVTGCFLTIPRPAHPKLYNIVRALGWVGFACHVICIGQSTLFIQILTVVIMITASVLCVLGWGSNEFLLCRRLNVLRVDPPGAEDRRAVAYGKLALSEEEENTMLTWGLFPQRSNEHWWMNYYRIKSGKHETIE